MKTITVDSIEQAASTTSTTSTTSTAPLPREAQKERIHAIPEDSILHDAVVFGRKFSEAPDSFTVAPLLCLAGKLLTPQVAIDFAGTKYPNLFNFVVAPPALRKSTSFKIPSAIAHKTLESSELHSGSASDSALFTSFETGPHKLHIEDEGNALLEHWNKQGVGKELAARYLKLHDGERWQQLYKNQGEGGGDERRVIETATFSFALGGTPNTARFAGVSTATGLRRRFGYYVGFHPAREIDWPESLECPEFSRIANLFPKLRQLEGKATLSTDAKLSWREIQDRVRSDLAEITTFDAASEARQAALGEAPSRTLKIAMIFEACRWAKTAEGDGLNIRRDTLDIAFQHTLACLEAAEELETIGRRHAIQEDADSILARIQSKPGDWETRDGWVIATKSQLTSTFAPHPNRAGAMTVTRLYGETLGSLKDRGLCFLINKDGRLEQFAFPMEGSAGGGPPSNLSKLEN